ncbi:CDP-glucose 4,6-dehydratase [Prochlorococcus sp. AH-736-F23]|nr:CDP-glucose 4,6-dehydratase [Prochlorococcus sp. AH-736-F23]
MKSIKELKKVFNGKKVLITGHTGFKGSWLSIVLHHLGANIAGVSIDCKTDKGPYNSCKMNEKISYDERLDICNKKSLNELINKFEPDFIFHLAAQALVSKSYNNPSETILTNAIGTLNLLEVIKNVNKKISIVLITSDKCYENIETFYGYKETDQLGGKDPYSASKACAEIIANSYIRSIFFSKDNINIATARAGNVIGGGDWSENRLIPDAVTCWQNNQVLEIRNPFSTRPWQHVLEPILGYLELACHINENKLKGKELSGNSFNFGPRQVDILTVENVIKNFCKIWGYSKYKISKNYHFEEAGLLNLCCDKANKILNWYPRLSIDEALLLTSSWYKEQNKSADMYEFTVNQIEYFLKK